MVEVTPPPEFLAWLGEKWLVWSDGINEGRNAAGEEYGMERFRSGLILNSPALTLRHAWANWAAFVDQTHLHDDACLALLVTKAPNSLSISSCSSQCKVARRFVEAWTQTAGYPDLERGFIAMAVDEAVTNIIRHTYKSQANCKIEVSVEVTATHLRFTLRDYGPPVDPEKLKGRDLDDIKPGGLGLHLIHSQFPVVQYNPQPDGNQWVLARPLPTLPGVTAPPAP